MNLLETDLFARPQTLPVLEALLARAGERGERSTTLLKPHDNSDAGDWFIFCPPPFNEALDIRETIRVGSGGRAKVWTQGCLFSFKVGDTLYDTPDAYLPWSEALTKFKICLSVIQASEVGPNVPGFVVYERREPHEGKLRYVSTKRCTQAQFVRFVIDGNDSQHECQSRR